MGNFLLVLLLFAAVFMVNVQADSMDDYLNRNKENHYRILAQMDSQMMTFEVNSLASLKTIDTKESHIIDLIGKANGNFDSLRFLSSLSKKCVNHYRQFVPSVEYAKHTTHNCSQGARNEIPRLLSEPKGTRNDLESYYKKYDAAINNCQKSYNLSTPAYTTCIQRAVVDADNYTNKTQKKFTFQMNAARGNGSANVNNALDCSYTAEKRVIAAIAEANESIQKCRLGEDICMKFWSNACSAVEQMKKSDVSSEKQTIPNPFYGRNSDEAADCVVLKFY